MKFIYPAFQDLYGEIYKKAFDLLSTDVEQWLLQPSSQNLLEDLASKGLFALKETNLQSASPKSRVRFLTDYVNALANRSASELRDNFLTFVTYADLSPHLAIKYIEGTWAQGGSPLSNGNIEQIEWVGYFL